MKARRWLQVWLVLLVASGCAQRSDWIGSTLVTVDLTGRWAGTFDASMTGGGGWFDTTLHQTGPKATGDLRLVGPNAGPFSGPSREPSPATCSSSSDLTGS